MAVGAVDSETAADGCGNGGGAWSEVSGDSGVAVAAAVAL